ncbi:uncharacterized protein N7482_009729 [Penicillium canariense]|uniref:Uncharacterized protein n=1 Tax=Penicillium canariense TaxID=189055 RepID=A0A9W9HPB0_9EURO|nr:uncharacterized protein N7482_009729 [Penicillium canariense]KAJ5153251.1 hypothetical protein N7482_009729 [Penicillium canariense]
MMMKKEKNMKEKNMKEKNMKEKRRKKRKKSSVVELSTKRQIASKFVSSKKPEHTAWNSNGCEMSSFPLPGTQED